jgi:hypothetical protein
VQPPQYDPFKFDPKAAIRAHREPVQRILHPQNASVLDKFEQMFHIPVGPPSHLLSKGLPTKYLYDHSNNIW